MPNLQVAPRRMVRRQLSASFVVIRRLEAWPMTWFARWLRVPRAPRAISALALLLPAAANAQIAGPHPAGVDAPVVRFGTPQATDAMLPAPPVARAGAPVASLGFQEQPPVVVEP